MQYTHAIYTIFMLMATYIEGKPASEMNLAHGSDSTAGLLKRKLVLNSPLIHLEDNEMIKDDSQSLENDLVKKGDFKIANYLSTSQKNLRKRNEQSNSSSLSDRLLCLFGGCPPPPPPPPPPVVYQYVTCYETRHIPVYTTVYYEPDVSTKWITNTVTGTTSVSNTKATTVTTTVPATASTTSYTTVTRTSTLTDQC
ncbi:hypothetical protein AX774_g5682 [Zancudomyces culisetae]|uniref:Uncharacterized protein n=1 Tax=Zancudomyces culisetae TaxID=1213189 RepID=A0A1R1PDC4_ZANCU|nr:hypothetical protein AX774_g7730 [Zancudomyces culisetae]OMH80878.1 hypothetical protein AX774_g5682 [Zancudomyces culisetae]|eukprot:OMH78872.1 hypothetical protein AX774_g7730 [Zancudomyces culisetae]